MAELKILIFPYFEELITLVNENICDRVIYWAEKCKTSWDINSIEEPEIGYQGMILQFNDGRSIYVNDLIVYFDENITQWLTDPNKRINGILLQVAFKNYWRELNYYFEVKRLRDLKRNKKRRRNKRIEDSLRNLR
ncbi:MAG TPA: hypothetical protein VIK14_15100 [Ignavibacteria bacterium]